MRRDGSGVEVNLQRSRGVDPGVRGFSLANSHTRARARCRGVLIGVDATEASLANLSTVRKTAGSQGHEPEESRLGA
jgi:hypothetical protein